MYCVRVLVDSSIKDIVLSASHLSHQPLLRRDSARAEWGCHWPGTSNAADKKQPLLVGVPVQE